MRTGASIILYILNFLPSNLRRAHQTLDRAVDAAYATPEPGQKKKRIFTSDADRVAFLFELYHEYTSIFPLPETPKAKRKKRK